MKIPSALMPHLITVEAFLGDQTFGRSFGTPRVIHANWVGKTTTSASQTSDADDVTGTLDVHPADVPPIGSRVGGGPIPGQCIVTAITPYVDPSQPQHYSLTCS